MQAHSPFADRGSLERPSEMLPQDLPPQVVRWMGWLMIAMFVTVLIAAIVVEVPETVLSPFVLVPTDGADPIQAPRLAVVTEVHVTEGQRVAAGAELFVLRSDEIRTWRTELTTATSDLQTKAGSIVKAEAAYGDQLNIRTGEVDQAKRELEFRQQSAGTKRDLIARTRALAESKIVAPATLVAEQLELDQAEKELTIAQRRLEAANLERHRTETEHAAWRAEANAEIEKLRARITTLKAPLDNSTDDLMSIRAPYDGVVIALGQRNAGNVVQVGQELCQLAPVDATPRARVMLKEQGLPRLAVGQRVRLFFEAFPYQRYGTVTGTLDWISPAAVASAGGQSFIALASPSQKFILVNQEPRPLQVGMKGEARIVVGGRRLIEYAFEPIRQLRENMRR